MKASKIIFPLIGQPKDRQRKTKYGHICFWAKNGKMGFVRFDKSGELIDKGFYVLAIWQIKSIVLTT